MARAEEIGDSDSLKAWLEDQPQEVAVWIAARAAARVLPVWWQAVLTQDWARERDVTALPVLRSLLISSVAAVGPCSQTALATSDAREALDGAVVSVGAALDDVESEDIADIDGAIAAIAAAAEVASNSATAEAGSAYTAGASISIVRDSGIVWTAVRTDAGQVADGRFPDALPLWHGGAGPLAAQWTEIKARVAGAPDADGWQFWLAWYDALLYGRPMLGVAARTLEMLEKIALIDPATWDKGPEVVNPVIREIWELHRLRADAAALRAEKDALLRERATVAQRSHNAPPGLVEDEPELAAQVTIIWAALDEAGEELEAASPDKSRLREIAGRMLAALRAVAAYCGEVSHRTIMSAATVVGSGLGVVILDKVVNNGRLWQFVHDLLSFSGRG